MRRLAWILLAAALSGAPRVAVTARAADANPNCDIGTYPAATLLLPYFEVDLDAPANKALNTIFTVVNTSRLPQIARVTIWTDFGYPVSWFTIFLTGYDAQTVSLYEIIARGRYPMTFSTVTPGSLSAPNSANPNIDSEMLCQPFGGTVPADRLHRLQKALTTGERDDPACPVGGMHRNAVGYVTIDVVNSCALDTPLESRYWTNVLLFDNVLTGDSIRINPDPDSGNYAAATPLVHIRAVPEGGTAGSVASVPLSFTFYDRYTPRTSRKFDRRQPLPSTFAVRFIEGGPTDFQTKVTMWREGMVPATASQCEYAKNRALPIPRANIVRFDEHENATSIAVDASTPMAASLLAASASFPPISAAGDRGGWMWLSLDHGHADPLSKRPSQNWISVQMSAEGRYAVDFDATWLANACATVPAAP